MKHSYEDFLQSEILLDCVKKCVHKSEISPEVKLRILFLLCDNYNYSDLKTKDMGSLLKNPLGIDDDLFEKPPDILTGDQAIELRELMFEEIKKNHSFFSSLRTRIKQPPMKDQITEPFETLMSNIKAQICAINESLDAQKKIGNVKSEAYLFLEDKCKAFISITKNKLSDSRKLFWEIVEEISADGKCQSLEAVEQILDRKINKNQEKIDELKFKLSEYQDAK